MLYKSTTYINIIYGMICNILYIKLWKVQNACIISDQSLFMLFSLFKTD